MSFEGSVFLWIVENEGHAKHINDEFSAFLTHALCVKPFPDIFFSSPAFFSCDQAAVSMKTSSPAKPLGTPLDGILQEEAAANAHSGRPSGQNQNPAAQERRAREASLDNPNPDVERGEVDLGNTTPGVELGEDPEVEKKRPASAGVKVEIPNNAAVNRAYPCLYKAAIPTHCLRPANTRRKSRTRPSSAWIQSLPRFWPQLRLLW